MRHRTPLLLACLAAASLASGPRAQQAPESEIPSFGTEVTVQWVLVPVVVRSARGIVDTLREEDFRLSVDGRPTPIESFHYDARSPLRLIVLQDLSGSMGTERRLQRSVQVVDDLLRHARPGDRFALGTFANRGLQVEVPATDDIAALREAIGRWRPYGMTALHDAIGWIPRITGGDDALRTAVLLITDGVDNASMLEPAAARELVRRARIPVYALGLASGDPSALTTEGEKLYRYADALNLLSFQTGGRYFPLAAQDDILAASRQILSELRHQYVLGFRATAAAASYRAIDVRVAGGRRWEVSHRRGYTGGLPGS